MSRQNTALTEKERLYESKENISAWTFMLPPFPLPRKMLRGKLLIENASQMGWPLPRRQVQLCREH